MITHIRLLQLLDYDPDTGIFQWKKRPGRGAKPAGTVAGNFDKDGYLVFSIDGKQYKAHRVAWFYVHGKWPDGETDHRNRIRNDNRIKNLREATVSQGRQNRTRKANASGFTGVYFIKGRYLATIKANGTTHRLGWFDAPEDAHRVYLNAKAKLHGDFSAQRQACG